MPSNTQISGNATERSAEKLLRSHGLSMVDRNFHCRAGEIDLIMLDQQHLVFVEVRLRSNQDYTSALESITRSKQTKIIRAAQFYLLNNPQYANYFCRFDVVASDCEDATPDQLIWIKDAFQASVVY